MNSMDKVICIQDGTNIFFSGRPHIRKGEVYHVLDVIPHTELKNAVKHKAAAGDWYQLVELPYFHWSGLFAKVDYDDELYLESKNLEENG